MEGRERLRYFGHPLLQCANGCERASVKEPPTYLAETSSKVLWEG